MLDIQILIYSCNFNFFEKQKQQEKYDGAVEKFGRKSLHILSRNSKPTFYAC